MKARFAGTCTNCTKRFSAGVEIVFSGGKVTRCPSCARDAAADTGLSETAERSRMVVRLESVNNVSSSFATAKARIRPSPSTGEATYESDVPWTDRTTGDLVALVVRNQGFEFGGGDEIIVSGRWRLDERWGMQFDVDGIDVAYNASEAAFLTFLRRRIPQIGPKRAAQILDVFGGWEDATRVFEETPERLTEIDGITPERAAEAAQAWRDGAAELAVYRQLQRIPELTDAQRTALFEEFGAELWTRLEANPYDVLDDLPFGRADVIATRYFKVAPNDPRRLTRIASLALRQLESGSGNTHFSAEQIIQTIAEMGLYTQAEATS
jgi:hypothetical protein